MIYCIKFSDVEEHLNRLGFAPSGRTEATVRFRAPSGTLITLRAPNIHGDVPEVLINDAFDAAGLAPPSWVVFWCD